MTDQTPTIDPSTPATVGHLVELRQAIVALDAAAAAEFKQVATRLEELPSGGILADLQSRLKAVEARLESLHQRLLAKGG